MEGLLLISCNIFSILPTLDFVLAIVCVLVVVCGRLPQFFYPQGWSCCKKRSTDFTEFLNFPVSCCVVMQSVCVCVCVYVCVWIWE